MKNNNQAIIRKLVNRNLKMSKKRNFFIATAIILTAFMITAVLNLTFGFVNTMQMNFIRMEGSRSHAVFGSPTPEQLKQLGQLDYVDVYGTGHYIGFVQNDEVPVGISFSLIHVSNDFFNHILTPAISDIVGTLPQEENEIMTSSWVLEQLGIENPAIGMTIDLTFSVINEEIDVLEPTLTEKTFILSGFFTSFDHLIRREAYLITSEAYAQKMGKSVHDFHGSVNVLFQNSNQIHQDSQRLIEDLDLSTEQGQGLIVHPVFDMTGAQWITMISTVGLMVLIFMLTGGLLIYNVLYTSVAKDVRFYGLLKGIGTTSKQIRQLVMMQVIRLCLIGAPIGLLLGVIVSFGIAPFLTAHNSTGSVSIASNVTVLLSPFVFLGACLFTLLTAIIGARKPAKKASLISPVEAIKYVGQVNIKDYKNTRTNAKLSKMALRNVFRERGRASVVFLSLILGMTIFISATLIIFSLNDEKALESLIGNSDFLIEDLSWANGEFSEGFDNEFLENLNALSTIENIRTDAHSPIVFTYQPALEAYVDERFSELEEFGWTRNEVLEFLSGGMYRLSSDELLKLNNELDVDAFERGEFAVIATNQVELFEDLEKIEAEGLVINGNRYEPTGNSFTIPIGGFVPDSSQGFSPHSGDLIMLVSHSFFEEWRIDEPQFVLNIRIDEVTGQEAYALADLEDLVGTNSNINLFSRTQLRQETEEARLILFVLGGGISLILASVGLMNFINSMSMGIIVRKRELATLESIGMTRKQLQGMLIFEGLWYGVITLLLVSVGGNGFAIGVYLLISNATTWSDFIVFNYPIIPTLAMATIILAVCVITPVVIYRLESKVSIVEKLREVE